MPCLCNTKNDSEEEWLGGWGQGGSTTDKNTK